MIGRPRVSGVERVLEVKKDLHVHWSSSLLGTFFPSHWVLPVSVSQQFTCLLLFVIRAHANLVAKNALFNVVLFYLGPYN